MSLRQIEAVLAVVLIFALGLFVVKPSMTGFVPLKTEHQFIGLVIDSSEVYTLRLNSSEPIVSLGISGKIVGSGAVDIWLGLDTERLLIWSSTPGAPASTNLITGMATGALPKDLIESESIGERIFVNECIETCMLPEHFRQSGAYDLIFEIEDGTVLQVNEIIYVTME